MENTDEQGGVEWSVVPTDEQSGVEWSVVAKAILFNAVLASADGQLTKCQYCGEVGRGTQPVTHEKSCAVLAAHRLLNRARVSEKAVLTPPAPAEGAAGQDKTRLWHQHLDECARCRKRPFDPCRVWVKILTSP